MTLGALGRKFGWQAWKDWLGKKNYTATWKKWGGRHKARAETGLAQKHGQKKIKQKVRPGAGKKSQKNLCLIGKKKKKRCLVKDSFCQMKGSKDEKFQIKAARVTLAQSYLGYFYHNSHSE